MKNPIIKFFAIVLLFISFVHYTNAKGISLCNISESIFVMPHSTETDACANAIKSCIVALNDLSQSDYCSLLSTINNNSLTQEQKMTVLEGNNAYDNLISAFNSASSVLTSNNFATLVSNEADLNAIWDKIEIETFGERPNLSACDAYNAQVKAIGVGWFACIVGTSFSIPGRIACSVAALYALDANDKAYPNCANGKNRGIVFSSWLFGDAENYCGNQYYGQ